MTPKNKKRMLSKFSLNIRFFYEVEMAGIEPASEKFGR